MSKHKNFPYQHAFKNALKFIFSFEGGVIIFSLLFAWWLMNHTFSYKDGVILIAGKAWSDFSWTVPMIRSFSLGSNFPVEAPLFPGIPIHYHFLFYLLVGMLEKIGLRIDYALNTPSILGLAALLCVIYYFAKNLFKSKGVAVLSVLFFLFNGSFSFVYFFIIHPLSILTPWEISTNTVFPSFGPYDQKIVSAFWNLNIYTNQRHLAAAFAVSLLVTYFFIKPLFNSHQNTFSKKISIALGVVLGCMFYFHLPVLLMTAITLFALMIFFKKLRLSGIIIFTLAAIICIPQYIYLNSGGPSFKLILNPGFLIAGNNLTFVEFNRYWVMNLGLHYFIIPIGFFLATKKERKIFIAFFISFLIGNLFQFSPDMAGNHKFFNYFMLVGSMFSAYTLLRVWSTRRVSKLITKPIVIIAIFFMVLSGIIDFFPIYNDSKMALADYQKNQDIAWIMNNTPPNAIFLNTQYLYAPESLAGRKIFFGWPYFSWSAGYNTDERSKARNEILSATSKEKACSLLLSNNISYIEITSTLDGTPDQPKFSGVFKKDFTLRYKHGPIEIYDVAKSCKIP